MYCFDSSIAHDEARRIAARLRGFALAAIFVMMPFGLYAEPGLHAGPVADDGNERDYVVVVTRPAKLQVVDMQAAEIVNACDVPGAGEAIPGTLVVA